MEGEKSGIKIWLYIEHEGLNTTHSMYLIEPSMDMDEQEIDLEGFAVDSISPVMAFEKGIPNRFLSECAMLNLDSKFYFLGGRIDYLSSSPVISDEFKLRVQVFDINDPGLGFRRVASLNAPKETPCVFSVHGNIYALGSSVRGCNFKGLGCGFSGIFERYFPDEDYWQVLPDPPKPFGEYQDIWWSDSATVLWDRYIYLGNTVHELYLVFDLQLEKWTSVPKSSPLATRFPYGALYVDDSLYYLTGLASWKYGTQFDHYDPNCDDDDNENEVRLVKISPLPRGVGDPRTLLNSICFKPGNRQVISTFTSTHIHYNQWRDIFHLGGHFFCYVVTTQLINPDNLTLNQPNCRGVWIEIFKDMVPDANSTNKQPQFRTLASFSYRISTPFPNYASFIRCAAFGSVPDSWEKAPLSKKQVAAKEREAFKAEQCHREHGGGSEGQMDCAWVTAPLKKKQAAAKEREALKTDEQSQHEDGGGSEGQMDGYVQKILAAREEEISRLKADLVRKDNLLKEYESYLAKSKGKLVLTASKLMGGHV